MKAIRILTVAALLATGVAGAAHASPGKGLPTLEDPLGSDGRLVVETRGGYSYYGPGPNYYLQRHPGPNCLPEPHPQYGWVCY